MTIEAKGVEEPTRREMLSDIKQSGIEILSIQGEGQGTGETPNLYRLNNPTLRATHALARHVKWILEGNSVWPTQDEAKLMRVFK